MENIELQLSEKIRGNAVSAYLMIFVSSLFLFNKTNKNINNPFVKSHTKSAILIHLGFLITYIIFISNSLFATIQIMGIGLNHIITNIIFIGLLGLIILGIQKSKNGLEFSISKSINISEKENLIDINGNGKISEKEKLTIILSFIPFIGFVTFGKYKNNKVIQNSTRVNILISLIITLFYIFGYSTLTNLFSLAYIILISFIGINLFTRNELIDIKLPKIFSPNYSYVGIITIINYLKNYFKNNDFKEFKGLFKENFEKIDNEELKYENLLKKKKDLKLPKFIIYIPIINLIFLFFRNTKYSFHIINGITITVLLIITGVLAHFGYFNSSLHILSLFTILFGIGYLNNRLSYRMPIIFDLYILLKNIISIFKFGSKNLKEKRAEDNDVSLKIKK